MEYAAERLDDVPEDVRAAMREALAGGLEQAKKRIPPGDGLMNILFGKDMGGWSLQVLLFHDERMWPGPHVIVNAFEEAGGDLTGRLAAKVDYTADDRRAIDEKCLEQLKAERRRLDEDIKKLEEKLGIGRTDG